MDQQLQHLPLCSLFQTGMARLFLRKRGKEATQRTCFAPTYFARCCARVSTGIFEAHPALQHPLSTRSSMASRVCHLKGLIRGGLVGMGVGRGRFLLNLPPWCSGTRFLPYRKPKEQRSKRCLILTQNGWASETIWAWALYSSLLAIPPPYPCFLLLNGCNDRKENFESRTQQGKAEGK